MIREGRAARQWRTVAVVAIGLGLPMTGCGSSKSQATQPTGVTAQAPVAQTSSTTNTSGSAGIAITDAKNLGTITFSGAGTTVTEQVSMGPLGYGSSAAPAPEVLQPCGQNYVDETATDAYVHGSVTLSYTQGTVPINAILNVSQALKDFGTQNITAGMIINHDGSWDCGNVSGNGGTPPSLSLQPNQSSTYEFWIDIGDVVTNAQPQLPQSELDTIYFAAYPLLDQQTGQTTVTGPTAIDCGDGPSLFPFAQAAPFTVAAEATENDMAINCKAVGGG